MAIKQKKKNVTAVQTLIGIKGFTEYGLSTAGGELLFFVISPINISVLSSDSVENKVRKLTLVLSAEPDIEIVCVDSAERFDDNKAYLQERINNETNPQIKTLLKKDATFLDEIQAELTTARQFIFIARCKGWKSSKVLSYANTVSKVLSEQGLDVHRMKKTMIKRLIAICFEASLTGENICEYDGEQYVDLKVAE